MVQWLELRNKTECMHLYPSPGVEKASQRDTIEEALLSGYNPGTINY